MSGRDIGRLATCARPTVLTYDLAFFALGVPAALIAGISKGGFGSGASFVGAMMLMLILSPGQALGVMLPLLMVIDAASMRPYWGRWNGSDARRLIIAAVPGVALGAAFWSVANVAAIKFLIGAVAILFVLWQILISTGRVRPGGRGFADWSAWPLGAAAGFTSFIAHAGGPWTAIYLLSRQPGKTEYQATTVIVFAAINVMKLVPFIWLGLISTEAAWGALLLTPAALLGTWIGVVLHAAIPQKPFFLLTYGLLVVTGLKLLFDALA